MRMQPDFEKANEIYFRLGIIYKQQQKYNQSLEVFTKIRIRTTVHTNLSAVLQIHCHRSSTTVD